MKLYHYDSHTGEFVGETEARIDPRAGTPIVPAWATTVAPPSVGANEAAVFVPSSGNWEAVQDYRGTIYWLADGSRHDIVALNAIPPLDALDAPPEKPAAERRSETKALIDSAAGEARMRFISPGALIDAEYLQAEQAAQAYKDAGYSGIVPVSIQCWADAAGITAQQAADDILATAQQWRGLLDQIRAIRLTGKAAVDAAADADIETTGQTYIDQLDALQPA